MRSGIWRWLKHFAYGLFAKSWNGAINGVYGFVGIATGSALNPEKVQAPNWEMAAYIFGTAFAISAIGYFKDNPFPERLPESQPPFNTTTKIEDGKITTTPVSPTDTPTNP